MLLIAFVAAGQCILSGGDVGSPGLDFYSLFSDFKTWYAATHGFIVRPDFCRNRRRAAENKLASTAAPEPGSLVLFLPILGTAGIVIRRRRK